VRTKADSTDYYRFIGSHLAKLLELVLEDTPYDIRLDATIGELAFKTAHHGIDVCDFRNPGKSLFTLARAHRSVDQGKVVYELQVPDAFARYARNFALARPSPSC
jgi:hypothetical protein